jgi:putative transposase
MSRVARECPEGYVYHIWNRAAGKLRLFKKDEDFLAFNRILIEAHNRHPIPLLDWCLMPTHWHFVVFPKSDRQVTDFFRWMTHTHAMRAITHRRVMGMGPLYQGRFKSLPVQDDGHLLTLLRYVQRNPLRAGEVKRAEQWRWGGEWARSNGDKELRSILSPWPIDRPRRWLSVVNEAQTDAEVDAIRLCVRRSGPFGDAGWTRQTAKKLNLQWTQRPRGRPKKTEKGG